MKIAEIKAIDFSRELSPILLEELAARGIDFAALTPLQHSDVMQDIVIRLKQAYMKGYGAGRWTQRARDRKNNLWKSQK